jgi:predicted Zn-dependent peptidase
MHSDSTEPHSTMIEAFIKHGFTTDKPEAIRVFGNPENFHYATHDLIFKHIKKFYNINNIDVLIVGPTDVSGLVAKEAEKILPKGQRFSTSLQHVKQKQFDSATLNITTGYESSGILAFCSHLYRNDELKSLLLASIIGDSSISRSLVNKRLVVPGLIYNGATTAVHFNNYNILFSTIETSTKNFRKVKNIYKKTLSMAFTMDFPEYEFKKLKQNFFYSQKMAQDNIQDKIDGYSDSVLKGHFPQNNEIDELDSISLDDMRKFSLKSFNMGNLFFIVR